MYQKVVVAGFPSVGKSTVISQLTGQDYVVGQDSEFRFYDTRVGSMNLELGIWEIDLQSKEAGPCWEYLVGESCVILVYDGSNEISYSELHQASMPRSLREHSALVVLVENQREGERCVGENVRKELMSILRADKFLCGNVQNLNLSWVLNKIVELHLDSIGDRLRRLADLSMSLVQTTFKGILALPPADRQEFQVFLSQRLSQKKGRINHEDVLEKWLVATEGNPLRNGPLAEEGAIGSEGELASDPSHGGNFGPAGGPTLQSTQGAQVEAAQNRLPPSQQHNKVAPPAQTSSQNEAGVKKVPHPSQPTVNPQRQRRRNPEGADQSEVVEDESEGAEDDDMPRSPFLDQSAQVEAAQNRLPPPQHKKVPSPAQTSSQNEAGVKKVPHPPQPTVNPQHQRRRNPEGAGHSEVAEDEREGQKTMIFLALLSLTSQHKWKHHRMYPLLLKMKEGTF